MKRPRISHIAMIAAVPCATWAQGLFDAGRVFDLEDWSYEPLYSSGVRSIDATFGEDVYGIGSSEIGNVEDLVMNDGGEVIALIAEVGGFWDIGDTHVSVPWDQVTITEDERIEIPVTEDSIDEFDLFDYSGLAPTGIDEEMVAGVDDVPLGENFWRASDLIGDYVRIVNEDGTWRNFGYVTDMLVEDGQVTATIVHGTGSYRPNAYAFPFGNRRAVPDESHIKGDYAGYWVPRASTYDLPVLVSDATSLPNFDETQLLAE